MAAMGLSLSVLSGLVFGGLNFWVLSRIVRGLVESEKVKKWKTGLFFFAKMVLMLGTFGLILKKGYVSPLPFLAGFTASLITGVLLKALKGAES